MKSGISKILIVTDSLGLPREIPELLSVGNTWPEKLKKALGRDGVDIYQYSIGGLDSRGALSFLESSLNAYKPDLIILQFGIVDCCPRVLKKSELTLLKKFPTKVSETIRVFIRRNRNKLLKIRDVKYVNKNDFSCNLRKIRDLFDGVVIFIDIMPSSKAYEAHTNGITSSIKEYNREISKVFPERVSFDKEECMHVFMSDFHHLNEKGQSLIFYKLADILT